MEITEQHRKEYQKFYRKRKKTTSIGINIQNIEKIQILKDLTEMDYLKYVYESTEDVKIFDEIHKITYAFYRSTGKRLPNKKYDTKKLGTIYSIEDNSFYNPIMCEEPKFMNGKWDYMDIKINDIDFCVTFHCYYSKKSYLTYYIGFFNYIDGRCYKIKFQDISKMNIFYEGANSKIKWERLNKVKNILYE